MDDAVTLLELHKLMYFVKESGEVPKLTFVKGKYGPYSTNLRHVLTEIEGHYVTGFGDASEEPGKVIELLPGAIEKAEQFLKSQPVTHTHITRVEELIEGFETAFGKELHASEHWVAKHEPSPAHTLQDAVRAVHEWNARKRSTFSAEHIGAAWERLTTAGWLN
jgi:hypothetical protein